MLTCAAAAPGVDSTVQASPSEVAITSSEATEPKLSTIEVKDAADKQDPNAAPSNNKILAVDLPSPPPGTYRVIWRATAVETHKTEDTFDFTIKPLIRGALRIIPEGG